MSNNDPVLESIFRDAEEHGADCGEGWEAGDLQQFILCCWSEMSDYSRKQAVDAYRKLQG